MSELVNGVAQRAAVSYSAALFGVGHWTSLDKETAALLQFNLFQNYNSDLCLQRKFDDNLWEVLIDGLLCTLSNLDLKLAFCVHLKGPSFLDSSFSHRLFLTDQSSSLITTFGMS